MRGKPKFINLSSLLHCQAFTSEFGSEAKPKKINEVNDLKGNQTIENHLLTVFAQVDVPILNKAIYDSSGCEELSLKSWNKPIRFRPCPKLQEKHFVNQKMTESNNQKISCQSIFCWMYLHWSVWERRLFSSLWGHSHKQANIVASLLSCKIKSLTSDSAFIAIIFMNILFEDGKLCLSSSPSLGLFGRSWAPKPRLFLQNKQLWIEINERVESLHFI